MILGRLCNQMYTIQGVGIAMGGPILSDTNLLKEKRD